MDRRGFTIIELLAVMILLGILAVLALAKYEKVRESGYLGTLKADLKNLSTHEEMYYQGVGVFTYSDDLDVLEFKKTPGVEISFGEADNAGWSARATHVASTWRCAIFVGGAEPLDPATNPGAIECAQGP